MKRFVRAVSADTVTNQYVKHSTGATSASHSQTGRLVREFYENTVMCGNAKKTNTGSTSVAQTSGLCETTTSKRDNKQQNKFKRNHVNHGESVKKISSNCGAGSLPYSQSKDKLFYAAQFGLVTEVEQLCGEGDADVNVTDRFLWTPLMCAVCGGHSEVVKILIEQGANIHAKNNIGQTALDLARLRKHSRIVILLNKGCLSAKVDSESQVPIETAPPVTYQCEACGTIIPQSSKTEHQRSVVHMLNDNSDNSKEPRPAYGIPKHNLGYQMMVRTGWDHQCGLGSKGQGRKYPIKTKLKLDKKGLGSTSKDTSKVTHVFTKAKTKTKLSASVNKPVTNRLPSTKAVQKKINKNRVQNDREWERNFRRYINE